MAYKNVFVSNRAKLSSKYNQLVIETEEIGKFNLPLEDIESVMVENTQSVISTYLFQQFAEHKIAIFFCDNKHIPCSTVLPFVSHSRHLKMLKSQIEMSVPFKKQLWKQIVTSKIENQAKCCEILGLNYNPLLVLSRLVKSGDVNNSEATAAVHYFKELLGSDFKRDLDIPVNAALNYGYSIIRGLIARTLVAHGFEPSLGVFHCSEQNGFNLADDLIEPFRPFVDLYVMTKLSDLKKFGSAEKKIIFSMLNYCISSNDQEHTISSAVKNEVVSLVQVINEESNELVLPKLIPLKSYECK